ncbi:MAG: type VI secretion system tube protein Hcp [Eubacteriales bacterium]|nr:type VI secretion system tube protein Hcp [Eubacteriales bacterium]
MKKNIIRVLMAVMLITITVSAVTINASAMNTSKDIFFKLDGIEGEANDSKHAKWINVLSFEHGATQSVQTGLPDVSGRGTFEPVVIRHTVDKSTPKFQEACMKGMRIGAGELHVCRPVAGAQTVVYKVKLEGIKIVSAKVMVEDLPDDNYQVVEEVKMLVNKLTWTATTIGLDNSNGGNTEACYDQVKKATMLDNGASLTTVILGSVTFVLAVGLVIVLVRSSKKKQSVVTTDSNQSEVDKK